MINYNYGFLYRGKGSYLEIEEFKNVWGKVINREIRLNKITLDKSMCPSCKIKFKDSEIVFYCSLCELIYHKDCGLDKQFFCREQEDHKYMFLDYNNARIKLISEVKKNENIS